TSSTAAGMVPFLSKNHGGRSAFMVVPVSIACSALVDLQTCTCDPATCQTECTDACTGGEITAECLGCVTNQCNTEFNACSGDTTQ
ncbi:MAG: hypothetical protein RIF41_13285, partial [Polyangiaceae bacterium]